MCSSAPAICSQCPVLAAAAALPCLPQVNKWFEKQRKKTREEEGSAPKRGRPKSGSGGGGSGGGGSLGKAAAVGAGSLAAPAAEEAAEAVQAAEQVGNAMDVDAEPAAPQGGEAQREQPAATPAAAVAAAAEPAAEAAAEPMATDAAAQPAAAAEDDTTPAPAARPAKEEEPSAAEAPAAPAASPATSPAKPGKTPATAPQQHWLSAEEKAQLVADLEAEAKQLRTSGLAAPLQALPAAGGEPAQRVAFSDARLAAHVAGQRAPLSQLAPALLPLFKAPDSEAAVEEAVLRR